MPDGSFVPVLGHEAFGGKVNRFGMGEFSANDTRRFAVCNYNWTFCIMQPGFSLSPAKPTPLARAPDQPTHPRALASYPPLLDSMSFFTGWPSRPSHGRTELTLRDGLRRGRLGSGGLHSAGGFWAQLRKSKPMRKMMAGLGGWIMRAGREDHSEGLQGK